MRLVHPAIRPAAAPIAFLFNGATVPALPGETITAALSAAGILTMRHMADGTPRGVHCARGACQDCVVSVDGRIGQRACMTKVAQGMDVASAAPAVLAPLADPPMQATPPERVCDLLVVGAGPAGLSAAIAAARAGANVIVLDERDAPGGQYHKPLAPSHAVHAPDPQWAEGAALRRRAGSAGVTILTDVLVWGAFAADEVAALVGGVAHVFRPRRLVLAPGAHERPMPLPGWTLPGVLTTGGLQSLARAQRVSPGAPVLIAGNGPLNLQLACELLDGGVAVAAVVEAARHPRHAALAALTMARHAPALARQGFSYLRRLRRAGVPVLWDSQVTALLGGQRVESAEIITPHGVRRIPAEVVAMNMGFQPETGLARALDLAHHFVDVGQGHLATTTDADGRTSCAEVFAVGDGASLGGSRVALARGRLAGLACARDLGLAAADAAPTRHMLRRAEAFQTALWTVFRPPPPAPLADATIVCRCEAVTAGRLRAEIAGGLTAIAALKRATRAGMGRCQGRFCATTIARLCPDTPHADAFPAPRLPVRPVPAAALMFEAAEFTAPLLHSPTPNQRLVPVTPAEAATRHTDVLVIGAGAVGLSTAYYLAQGGADVLVADRDEAGFAASTANAGSLHVQLIPYDFGYPGMPDDGGPAAHTLPLSRASAALWQDIAAASGESLGLSREGGLVLAANAADLDLLRAKSAMERRWGTETHIIGPNELHSLAPHLAPGLAGASFCPGEGRIDPLRGTMALARLAQGAGARLLKGAEVHSIARVGTAWHVQTGKGLIVAGRVVNCAGAWGAAIGRMVGLDLPVTGTVQQVIVTEPAPRLVEHLVAMAHRHLSLKQQDSGGLLIGGGWFGSFDPADGRTRTLRRNIEGNLWVAGQVLPALRGLQILRAWTGINLAIDRAPILGPAPGLDGFFNALTANGYTLGPGAGRVTADAVLHGTAVDPHYRVERFG